MKDRGDAVADRLPVAVGQRHIDGKSTPGRGIICRSKASPCRSTMPGSTSRPSASRCSAARPVVRTEGADFAAGDPQRGLDDLAAEQRPAAFDEDISHDNALRGLGWARPAPPAASYFARKSSTRSFRKSGRAVRRPLVVPVPPRQLRQPVGNGLRKPALDRPRRISRNDGVGRHILGHDRTGCDHRAGADLRPGSTMAPCPIQTSWPIWTRCSRRHSKKSASSLSPGK